jgi:hypothetical protein
VCDIASESIELELADMRHRTVVIVLLLGVILRPAHAYELVTHAQITEQAFLASMLNSSPNLLFNLGLGPWIWGTGNQLPTDLPMFPSFSLYPITPKPLGSSYYDMNSSNPLAASSRLRSAATADDSLIQQYFMGISPWSLNGWMLRGAFKEDDNPITGKDFLFSGNLPTDGNAWVLTYDLARPENHFFDPIQNLPLNGPANSLLAAAISLAWNASGGLTEPIETAPSWAMGTSNPFGISGTRDRFLNHFSIMDLHEAIWRATTGQPFTVGIPITASGLPVTEADRIAYWATAFRALGDILHLNQDMSQPQHTRNEPHNGTQYTGEASAIEMYIEQRAKASVSFYSYFGGQQSIVGYQGNFLQLPPLPFYPTGNDVVTTPTFLNLSDYWSTKPGSPPAVAGGPLPSTNNGGMGLADYSNQGFFTLGHNIGSTPYLLPNPAVSAYVLRSTVMPNAGQSTNRSLNSYYYMGSVGDNLNANVSLIPIRMSRPNIFVNGIGGGGYSLDTGNYDDMVRLLLPRAVAYSTGIINYIFRGSMGISLPSAGVYSVVDHAVTNSATSGGFAKIKLTLTNTSPPINDPRGLSLSQDMYSGTLMAVVKYHVNNCYKPDLSGDYAGDQAKVLSCRSSAESIVASAPITTFSLTSGASQELTFDFSGAPLPMSATDLYLQVIYRGQLGSEADAVVVATKDIPEISYLAVYVAPLACLDGQYYKMNSDGSVTDAIASVMSTLYYHGQYVSPADLQSLFIPVASSVSATFQGPFTNYNGPDTGQTLIANLLANASPLVLGQFIRLAILTEDQAPLQGEVIDSQILQQDWVQPIDALYNEIEFSPAGINVDSTPLQSFEDSIGRTADSIILIWSDGGCGSAPIPSDIIAADGNPFPVPQLVPVSMLSW